MRLLLIFGVWLTFSAFFLSCAHKRGVAGAPLLEKGPVPSSLLPPSLSDTSSELKSKTDHVDWNDLKAYDQVVIDIPYADVSVTQDQKHHRGTLQVNLLKGKENCKLEAVTLDSKLFIQPATNDGVKDKSIVAVMTKPNDSNRPKHHSSIPSALDCYYSVIMNLHQATDLMVTLKRGSVNIENWGSVSYVKMDWGGIDVSSVGPLTVVCDNCDLTGTGINGPLRYEINTGNVGVDNLVDSVDGKTLGDTVLKWSQVKSGSKIHLVSDAGDVILSFPGKLPLVMDLQVPHGEIYSIFTPSEHGVPLSVVAKQGNIKLLRK